MILSAHQPAYLPWLGYFAKIAAADAFVLHDRSRIGRRNMLNRNRIRTAEGPLLLSVPLSHPDLRAERPLDEVRVVDDGWRRRHWKAIQMAYRRAPYFDLHAGFLAGYYAREYATLDEVCVPFIDYCAEILGLPRPLLRVSRLGLPPVDRQSIIRELCRALGADTFIAGPHARDYLDRERIEAQGVQVEFFHYEHPTYPQSHPGFVSHLSVLDLLMNCGPQSADVVKEGVA
ncbi:WbqC family protein [Streptomyces celluloflavus]|uniref:WbqC family protein n=1 Tax=Streptomyces celluloflavus TaxID=58344 RepID=UPI003657705D